MKQRVIFIGAAVLAVLLAGVAIVSSWREQAELTRENAARPAEARHADPAGIPPERGTELAASTSVAQSPDEPLVAAPPNALAQDEDERSEDPAKMFKADDAGNLVLKERTRLNVEKLSALYTPDERQQRLAVIEQTLPASAYRQLVDLLERYENFMRASRQALPPGAPASTVDEMISQHETLHALRVAHFGAEATEAMYGREERISRQLLDFMNLEQHEGLTLEEKAIKAQEMLLRSPELAAAYAENRNTPRSGE